jgi:hypothetical protein
MDVPGIVAEALGGESVRAHVTLEGPGADALFVTPTRTLAYEDEGLLSDESVTEIPHDAERITVSAGRRKATIRLAYGIDDDREVVVPARHVDEAIHPLLAGVLAATGVTGEGETVKHTHRFSELTLVVTSERVAKHVGGAVWDAEHDVIPFESVRGLALEEGSVSTQLVLETEGRQERIKTPAEGARRVYADLEDALLAYHGADTYEEFRRTVAEADGPVEADTPADDDAAEFAETDLDPISMTGAEEEPPEAERERRDAGADGPEPEVDERPGTAESGQDAAGKRETGANAGPEHADSAPTGAEEAPQASGDIGRSREADEREYGDATRAGAEGEPTATGERTDRDAGFEGSAFESAASRQSPDQEAVAAELRALDEALARQADLIEEQRAAIEALADELDLD